MAAKFKAAPIKPQREIYARFPFVSAVDPAVQYKTTIYTDGSDHCTCEGFRYRETCKHVRMLRQPASVVRIHI